MNTVALPHPTSDRSLAIRLTRGLPRLAMVLALAAAAAAPSLRADDPPSNVDALFNLEVSDKYLTPRGMIVVDHGITFQALALAFINVYKGAPTDFINSASITAGFWNDYTTHPIAEHLTTPSLNTDWVEIDPIAGVTIGFAKNFKLDVTYSEYGMQILDIGTSQNLETKLSYDDSSLLGAWALHPYFSYYDELSGKSTAAANFGIPTGYYFDVGIDPSATFGSVKVELPVRVLLPSDNFYGEHFAKTSTVGLWEVSLKASMPADFMPKGYGHWNMHVGINFMDFVDKNLQQEAIDGGFGPVTKNSTQVFVGISTFF